MSDENDWEDVLLSPHNPRKKVKEPSKWKKNKLKVSRNRGEGKQPTVACNHANGKCVSASLMPADIQYVFNNLYVDSRLIKYVKTYLWKLVDIKAPAAKRPRKENPRTHTCSVIYHVVTKRA